MSHRETASAQELASWKRDAQTLERNFDAFDKNGNGVLSQGELLYSSAPFKFLQEYQDITNMARSNSNIRTENDTAAFNKYIGDTHTAKEGISVNDLRVLQVAADNKSIDNKVSQFRAEEIASGVKDAAVGFVAGAAGTIVGAAPGFAPYFGFGLNTVATRLPSGVESLVFSQKDSLRDMYESRRKMLDSW